MSATRGPKNTDSGLTYMPLPGLPGDNPAAAFADIQYYQAENAEAAKAAAEDSLVPLSNDAGAEKTKVIKVPQSADQYEGFRRAADLNLLKLIQPNAQNINHFCKPKYTKTQNVVRFFQNLLLFPFAIFNALFRTDFIPVDEIGLEKNGSDYNLLRGGEWYTLGSPVRGYSKVKISEPIIKHGPISIISVPPGKVGIVQNLSTGEHEVLMPGRHAWKDANRQFVDNYTVSGTAKIGPSENTQYRYLIVQNNEAAFVTCAGNIIALKEGRYLLPQNDYGTVGSILRVNESHLAPVQSENMLTDDGITVSIKSDVSYKITDPMLAYTHNGKDLANIEKNINHFVTEGLTQQLQAHALISGLLQDEAGSSESEASPSADKARRYFDKVQRNAADHARTVLAERGIEIASVVIRNFKVSDKTQEQLSLQAKVRSEGAAAYASAKAKARALQLEAEGEAKAARTAGEADAAVVEMRGQASANVIAAEGRAKATAAEQLYGAAAKTVASYPNNSAAQQAVLTEVAMRALGPTDKTILVNGVDALAASLTKGVLQAGQAPLQRSMSMGHLPRAAAVQ